MRSVESSSGSAGKLRERAGVLTIFAAETNRERHRMAFAIGADVAIDPRKDDAIAPMESETSGTGVDARSKTESAVARHLKVHS
jgi:threonine dehydrogenase-like Zn-dependent dehydrogenase